MAIHSQPSPSRAEEASGRRARSGFSQDKALLVHSHSPILPSVSSGTTFYTPTHMGTHVHTHTLASWAFPQPLLDTPLRFWAFLVTADTQHAQSHTTSWLSSPGTPLPLSSNLSADPGQTWVEPGRAPQQFTPHFTAPSPPPTTPRAGNGQIHTAASPAQRRREAGSQS